MMRRCNGDLHYFINGLDQVSLFFLIYFLSIMFFYAKNMNFSQKICNLYSGGHFLVFQQINCLISKFACCYRISVSA